MKCVPVNLALIIELRFVHRGIAPDAIDTAGSPEGIAVQKPPLPH